jgi:hypothetical protein
MGLTFSAGISKSNKKTASSDVPLQWITSKLSEPKLKTSRKERIGYSIRKQNRIAIPVRNY